MAGPFCIKNSHFDGIFLYVYSAERFSEAETTA